jgi:hypothetical protein
MRLPPFAISDGIVTASASTAVWPRAGPLRRSNTGFL